jgi:hypothetical protein
MYGLVNKAVQDLISESYGDDKWEAVKQKAGVDEEIFISHDSYPDEVTYRLVEAASEVLELPADSVLEAFGKHWILNTASKGYGEMLDAVGGSLGEFLENLPDFHTRVMVLFPNLKPPTFKVSDRKDRSLRLHYHTDRRGLTQFVVGILQGLAQRFQTEATITHEQSRSDGADHDVFLVEW